MRCFAGACHFIFNCALALQNEVLILRLEKTSSTVSTACSHNGKEVTFITPKGKKIRALQNEVFNTLLKSVKQIFIEYRKREFRPSSVYLWRNQSVFYYKISF